MKKALFATLLLCSFCSMVLSQTMIVKPFGVSPRDIDSSRVHASFDRPYNGLVNVGVETRIYFKGFLKGATLSSPTWTLLSAPSGSAATIGTPVEVDTSTQLVAFTPDVEGTFKISFTSDTYADTATVNAGKYLGIEDGKCGQCHAGNVTEWEETGHYSLFEEKMTTPGYYRSSCIQCHTTGYDVKADNDGFDDRTQHVAHLNKDTTFVFPDSAALVDYYASSDGNRYSGVWDSLLVFFPNSMKLARIQCESCHGPGSAHFAVTTDSKMIESLSADNCALCHDSGTHHVYPEQWDVSGHANPPAYPAGRTGCVRCHTGSGFVQFVEGDTDYAAGYNPITCATCHDPHDATNDHQLRTVEATLANGVVVTEGGSGKLCMNCHQGRRDADTYTDEPHGHYGPHYVPQADMLMATNAITFGEDLPSSPHLYATENACVDCHMYPGHVDENRNVIMVGSHTFKVTDEAGVDNVEICSDCHGNVGTSFSDKKFYIDGHADHDGDGVARGLQDEVRGLMAQLAYLLPAAEGHVAYDPHDDPDTTWTKTQLKAAFNYDYVYYDGSFGIHNPAFTVALLKVSIETVGGVVAVGDDFAPLPLVYELSQNFPNPFNPVTTIDFSIPENGLLTLTVYNSLGQVVRELMNEEMKAGNHSVTFTSDNLSSGLYFYQINVNGFSDTKKMILLR